jgi:uncharacterized protein (TIGR02594 family)
VIDKTVGPPWLRAAWRDEGLRETDGPNRSPWIDRMWLLLGVSWLRGQPYCGGGMARWMQAVGASYPRKFWRAMAWAEWGIELAAPEVGAVAVVTRGPKGKGLGHVGLFVGFDGRGRPLIYGANQGDTIRMDPFDPERIVGYYWPASHSDLITYNRAPVYASNAASSTNEG